MTVFITLGGGVLVLAIVVMCLVRFGPMGLLNIPNKAYWTAPERTQVARQMLLRDTAVIFSVVLLMLSVVPAVIALHSGDPRGMSPLLIAGPLGGGTLALVGYAVWMVARRYRPAPG